MASEFDASYWNDDPHDPMPGDSIDLSDAVNSAQSEDDMMERARRLVDDHIARLATWWERRIAREQARPNPHPQTETIAANIASE